MTETTPPAPEPEKPWRTIPLSEPLTWGDSGRAEELRFRMAKADDLWGWRQSYDAGDVLALAWRMAGGSSFCPASAWKGLSLTDGAGVYRMVDEDVLAEWEPVSPEGDVEFPYEYELQVPIPAAKSEDPPTTRIVLGSNGVRSEWIHRFPSAGERTFGDFLTIIRNASGWPEARVRSLRNPDAAHLVAVAGRILRPFLVGP